MKKISFFLLSLFSFFLLAKDIPTLSGPIVDEAKVLESRDFDSLSALIREIFVQKGPQIQVLIVDSLEGDPIEDFSIRVVDQWKIGQEKKDNGVLFLIAVKDHEMRMEVGRGLEGDLPDVMTFRILEGVKNYFRKTDYAGGVRYGVESISKIVKGDIPKELKANKSAKSDWSNLFAILFFLFFFFVINVQRLRRRGGIFPGGLGGGGWGDRGGGGDDWRGGGGGFGGGGSSDKW